ncbi:MAG: flagella basal body P-ring formation protein FlgA [Alphaproteobacteria bacterium]|nr:flagella basal body P-ring formation protein FlgA [Alphaproteobacteria bacterium]
MAALSPLPGRVFRGSLLLSGLVVYGGFAFMLGSGLMLKRSRQVIEELREIETVDVLVAARDIEAGARIGPEDVALRALQPEMVPSAPQVFSDTSAVGRVARERILGNEILRRERLEVSP